MATLPKFTEAGASFSADRAYRCVLWRIWDATKPRLGVCMLNPSVASETKLDHTVTRMVVRAVQLGYGGVLIGNAYDLVSTDPIALRKHPMPCSDVNDSALLNLALKSSMFLCAWGDDVMMRNRSKTILGMLRENGVTPYALRLTKSGQPSHPLYLPYELKPFPMEVK